MGCTNSPLTLTVTKIGRTVFELNCTPLGDSTLIFFPDTLDDVDVTFLSANEVPTIPGVKAVSEAFEILSERKNLTFGGQEVHLRLPYDASVVADPRMLRLYELGTNDKWSIAQKVDYHLSFDLERLDFMSVGKIKVPWMFALVLE